MSRRVILLHDTDDRDFARDVSDFIEELGVEVEMIVRSPDGGLTLQGKEEAYFEDVDAAVFLITPGSERKGKKYPSPSVADEMGRAKEKFKKEPWRIIYLVDTECAIQAVDQITFTTFTRTDHRTMVEMLRKLVVGLKDSGAFEPAGPPPAAPQVNIADLAAKTDAFLKKLCVDFGGQPGGTMWSMDFMSFVRQRTSDQAGANLAIRDLQLQGLVVMIPSNQPGIPATMALTAVGWELVRHERVLERRRKEQEAEKMAATPGTAAYRVASVIPRKPIGGQR